MRDAGDTGRKRANTPASPMGDDPMALLSLIAGRAMVAGADPSAPVSPDHDLLMLCDAIAMLKRQNNQADAEWRAVTPRGSDVDRQALSELRRTDRALRGPLVRLGRMRAVTPAGIFAKAVAVRLVGSTAAHLGNSLADDILNCAALRKAIWPTTEGAPV